MSAFIYDTDALAFNERIAVGKTFPTKPPTSKSKEWFPSYQEYKKTSLTIRFVHAITLDTSDTVNMRKIIEEKTNPSVPLRKRYGKGYPSY